MGAPAPGSLRPHEVRPGFVSMMHVVIFRDTGDTVGMDDRGYDSNIGVISVGM